MARSIIKPRYPYWKIKWNDRPFNHMDINRELHPPSTYIWNLDGCVGLRCDDDFWSIAYLPWKYHIYSAKELSEMLWVETRNNPNVEYKPDSGDPWWRKYWGKD